MAKRLLLLVPLAAALAAQDGTPVNQVDGPPQIGVQYVLGYSGSNLTSVCMSKSLLTAGNVRRGSSSLAAASATQASPTVIAVTHQFAIGSRPNITIAGVTGSGYTGINTTFVATVVDSTHMSVPFNSGALGAATWTSATFTTTAPRLNLAEWAVKILAYDGSNNLILTGWLAGSSSYQAKCSDATGTGQVQ